MYLCPLVGCVVRILLLENLMSTRMCVVFLKFIIINFYFFYFLCVMKNILFMICNTCKLCLGDIYLVEYVIRKELAV